MVRLPCLARGAGLALLLFAVAAGCGSKDSSSSSSAPDCSTGTETADISSDAPAWIQDNFTCVRVTVSGDNVVMETQSLPPYPSYYYGEGHALYDATLPSRPNPNTIVAQNVTMTFPSSPTLAASTSTAGLGIVGIAVDGIVIFNSQANPPDVLADEAETLDANTAHPTEHGVYHYHLEPAQLSDDDDHLIGVAIDGFPIYGRRDEDGTKAFASGDNWHEHATDLFPDGVPHYHVVYDNFEDNSDGDSTEVPYMIGTELAGTAGSVSGG